MRASSVLRLPDIIQVNSAALREISCVKAVLNDLDFFSHYELIEVGEHQIDRGSIGARNQQKRLSNLSGISTVCPVVIIKV